MSASGRRNFSATARRSKSRNPLRSHAHTKDAARTQTVRHTPRILLEASMFLCLTRGSKICYQRLSVYLRQAFGSLGIATNALVYLYDGHLGLWVLVTDLSGMGELVRSSNRLQSTQMRLTLHPRATLYSQTERSIRIDYAITRGVHRSRLSSVTANHRPCAHHVNVRGSRS